MLNSFASLDFGFSEALFVIILLVIFAFELFMFITAARNEHLSGKAKALWLIGMLIIHPFVAIAYYFVEYNKDS